METELLLVTQAVDHVVAGSADPQQAPQPGLPVKLLADAFFAMQTPGNQVMAGQLGTLAEAQLAMIGC
ncbi:MAG: hypothetical protein R3296_03225 [Oleiphilaceae bacterium]|nr:hypothetical protein [Oleiphilaceae bacterium]